MCVVAYVGIRIDMHSRTKVFDLQSISPVLKWMPFYLFIYLFMPDLISHRFIICEIESLAQSDQKA